MFFLTVVKVALKSLLANKLRSVLAMLGIIIGVWSVISALALATGAQQKVLGQVTSMGTNRLMITPGERMTGGGANTGKDVDLKIDDAAAMLKIPELAKAAPVVRGQVQAKYQNRNTHTSVQGVGPAWFGIRSFDLDAGRLLTDGDIDASGRVTVMGAASAAKLFGSDYFWALGQEIQLNGVSYRVIGFLKAKGDQGWFNPDDQVIVPYTTGMKQVLGQTNLDEIDVSAKDELHLSELQSKVSTLLRKRHHLNDETPDDFYVRNQADALDMASNIKTILTSLLGGIAGISLLVGGIGVMNIMLVTVAERTREIGIRKAIGARRRDILRQFLIESVVMSGTGGGIGAVLGLITAIIVTWAQTSVPLVVTWSSVVLALGFSAGVGIFFGYYPALRASRLDPIVALRYE